MKFLKLLILLVAAYGLQTNAQSSEIAYTMGYNTIDINVTADHFLNRYIAPGQDPVCGFYSKYNNTMYINGGEFIKHLNPDYIYESLGKCATQFSFNNGPRPYAMMEFDVTIDKVDYETNTIYAKTDGANLIITTFNDEIDAFYDTFYKHERLGAVHMHLILKNWDYTPESEDSYRDNVTRLRSKSHFVGKKAKNNEELLHDYEIQKED
jgi:hypothetical protein